MQLYLISDDGEIKGSWDARKSLYVRNASTVIINLASSVNRLVKKDKAKIQTEMKTKEVKPIHLPKKIDQIKPEYGYVLDWVYESHASESKCKYSLKAFYKGKLIEVGQVRWTKGKSSSIYGLPRIIKLDGQVINLTSGFRSTIGLKERKKMVEDRLRRTRKIRFVTDEDKKILYEKASKLSLLL